jgi:hypothetical protein
VIAVLSLAFLSACSSPWPFATAPTVSSTSARRRRSSPEGLNLGGPARPARACRPRGEAERRPALSSPAGRGLSAAVAEVHVDSESAPRPETERAALRDAGATARGAAVPPRVLRRVRARMARAKHGPPSGPHGRPGDPPAPWTEPLRRAQGPRAHPARAGTRGVGPPDRRAGASRAGPAGRLPGARSTRGRPFGRIFLTNAEYGAIMSNIKRLRGRFFVASVGRLERKGDRGSNLPGAPAHRSREPGRKEAEPGPLPGSRSTSDGPTSCGRPRGDPRNNLEPDGCIPGE